jgi:hypothetical protein
MWCESHQFNSDMYTKLTKSARNKEIDSGESREAAPETNCFAPFGEMGAGSAGYILWVQQVLDVSHPFPFALRSVSASLLLGLHARPENVPTLILPQDCLSTFQRRRSPMRADHARRRISRIDSSPRGDTPSFSPDSAWC